MSEPVFNLMSAHGNLLAVRNGVLQAARPEADPETEFLTVPATARLQGMRAMRLVRAPVAQQMLSRAFLVLGKAPGIVGLMNDEMFLTASGDGSPGFTARQFGPAEQFRLVAGPPVATRSPKIWIEQLGNVGNRALLYLVAEGMRRLVPGAEVLNIPLPEFGMHHPVPEPPAASTVRTGGWDRFWFDMPGLADCLRRGVMEALVIDGYCYRLEYYPPRQECRELLGPMFGGEDAPGFGPGELVCSVRADEILRGIHPEYLLLPPSYYRLLAAHTGLDLVFYGQLGDDPYSQSLREAFPQARFIAGRNAGYDFEMLRRSKNIAVSLSTFAWLAAWLSEADQVYIPVGGIFNPVQQGNQMFLPLDDPAFRYVLLPYAKAVNIFTEPEKFAAQKALFDAGMRLVAPEELRDICARAATIRPYGPYVGGFDPDFYATANRLEAGDHPLDHFVRQGFREQRAAAAIDPAFYVQVYPEVAMELAAGKYLSPLEHYVAEGWKKGFVPTPAKLLSPVIAAAAAQNVEQDVAQDIEQNRVA